MEGTLNQPQTQNPYTYALNSPITGSDPSGELPRTGYRPLGLVFMAGEYAASTPIGQKCIQVAQKFLSKPSIISMESKIPSGAKNVLQRIEQGGGNALEGYTSKTFQNKEGLLPKGGNYIEHDIKPFVNETERGLERIIIDTNTGKAWYTPDHYETFIQIK